MTPKQTAKSIRQEWATNGYAEFPLSFAEEQIEHAIGAALEPHRANAQAVMEAWRAWLKTEELLPGPILDPLDKLCRELGADMEFPE